MRDNFTFNGNEYSVQSTLRKGLTYRFINKNLLLRGSDLASALGYSYTSILKTFLLFSLGLAVTFSMVLLAVTLSLEAFGVFFTAGASADVAVTLYTEVLNNTLMSISTVLFGIWCLVVFLYGVLLYFFRGHDYYLIRKELDKVLEKHKEEMFALNEEEEAFRKEFNIVGETSWSITQADKRSLLEVILLEDVNTRSLNKKHLNRKGKVVSNNNPELEQYRIRNN